MFQYSYKIAASIWVKIIKDQVLPWAVSKWKIRKLHVHSDQKFQEKKSC